MLRRQCKLLTFAHRLDDRTHTHPRRCKQLDSDALAMHVSSKEITIAKLLQDTGYDTAHIGKWHLNGRFNLPGQPQPNHHGFSHWFSTQNNALPNHRNPYNFVRNGIPTGPIKGFSAQIVTDEAIHWLRSRRDKKKPFFLFVCYHEPHEPIATDQKFEKLHPADDPSHSAYWGNVTQRDAGFGRLITQVDRLKARRQPVHLVHQRQRTRTNRISSAWRNRFSTGEKGLALRGWDPRAGNPALA